MHSHLEEAGSEADKSIVAIPPHPLDIKPSGNAYTGSSNAKLRIGMLAPLADETISSILELLDASSLVTAGKTCKFLYAFARLDDAWKILFLEWVPVSLSFSIE
jgi:hypothetical protein